MMGYCGAKAPYARLLLVLVALSVVWLSITDALAEPSRVDASGRMVVDIGEHILGERFSKTITLRNPLDTAIRVTSIRSSCGCLSATVNPSTIEAKGAADVQVDIDGLGFAGAFRKSIFLQTDNETLPLLRLVLAGHFDALDHNLFCIPKEISMGPIQAEQQIDQVVVVRRNGLVNLGPVQILPSVSNLSAVVDEKRSTEKTLYFRLTILTPATNAETGGEILIQGPGKKDFVRLPIRSQLGGPVDITPFRVLLAVRGGVSKLYVRRTPGSVGRFLRYYVDYGDVEIVSCEESGWPDSSTELALRTGKLHTGFNKARLLLEFDGLFTLQEVELVGWRETQGQDE